MINRRTVGTLQLYPKVKPWLSAEIVLWPGTGPPFLQVALVLALFLLLPCPCVLVCFCPRDTVKSHLETGNLTWGIPSLRLPMSMSVGLFLALKSMWDGPAHCDDRPVSSSLAIDSNTHSLCTKRLFHTRVLPSNFTLLSPLMMPLS